MKVLRTLSLMLLVLVIGLTPASSRAAVFVSVGFAPPPLPVYVQPPCPQPGWMWTPGYWAYGPDGYYWVPGTWVPAPYAGALWTPGYWGWNAGMYMWHPGYWGRHVGYYGGVNYGFGFFGVGFVGGAWRGGVFAYNTAVMRVNTTVIRNTYIDRTVIERNTIVNDRHVAYSGGPGGINHPPNAEENRYSREQHMSATSYQVQHRNAAMNDRASYFNNNHGQPNNAAMSRPMNFQGRGLNNNGSLRSGQAYRENQMGGNNPMYQHDNQMARPNNNARGQNNSHPQSQMRESRPQPQQREPRPAQQREPRGGGHNNDHGRNR
jgi:WXXGXW repeat (2 copies)